MNILIIENVWMGGAKYGLFDKTLLTSFAILPTLHARQIASITPEKHRVHVLNERYETINFNKKYDIVHINYTTSTTPRAYEIADIFRKKNIKVVLSGLHASSVPNEAKQHADSVLLGRGELNWLDLLDDVKNNNLKEIYLPVNYDKSTHLPPTNVQLPGFVMSGAVEATRGCPYKCDFCPESNIPGGSNYYTRPVEDVINEIKNIPQKIIMFYDSSLTIKPSYTKTLFEQMKKLKKKFFCNGNSNVLSNDLELVKLSKDAGCIGWLIGFESVFQKTIDNIGKKTNQVDEYIQAVKNLHENKMVVIGDFMFGFDTDTPDVFNQTLDVIKNLQIDVADFCTLTPFPGTPVFKKLEKEGRLLTKDWSKYNLKNIVFQPKNMSSDDVMQGLRKMYIDYYSIGHSTNRIVKNLKQGFYPFFSVITRNMISTMNSRKLFIK